MTWAAVEQAATGAEAMRLAEVRAPSLAILDLGLPDADGKSAITTLRQRWKPHLRPFRA